MIIRQRYWINEKNTTKWSGRWRRWKSSSRHRIRPGSGSSMRREHSFTTQLKRLQKIWRTADSRSKLFPPGGSYWAADSASMECRRRKGDKTAGHLQPSETSSRSTEGNLLSKNKNNNGKQSCRQQVWAYPPPTLLEYYKTIKRFFSLSPFWVDKTLSRRTFSFLIDMSNFSID